MKNIDIITLIRMCIQIASHPKYDDSALVIKELLRITIRLKKDVGRLIKLQDTNSSKLTEETIKKYKKNILGKLQEIEKIREEKRLKNEEQWRKILKAVLSRIEKHSLVSQESIEELFTTDSLDISPTGINFLVTYLRVVSRVSEDRLYFIFK